MNPYSQLHMMQQAGAGQFIPGLGTMGPTGGGAANLQAMARQMGSPIAGSPMVDTSPMSSLNYQGPGSGMVNLAGNLMLTPMMQNQGMLPIGSAGSYMQAQRQNQFQQMQGNVIQDVAGQDTEGIFRSIRGAAALAGMPMDREQTKAAQEFAQTIAEQGPLLGILAPGLMDAMSGETGSVQAMASQITNANRYMTDPTTGQLGFSKDSNKELIDGLFESMFNQDNIVKMQGLRAGDMGELYSSMSVKGLAGPEGSLRDRTIGAVRDIQNEGGNADVDVALKELSSYDSDNLETLSNKDLATLRESSSAVSSRITEADTDKISSQLQDYVKSLSAIREVFGENGNPNAPIPELVGALEALTSGKMQQFDATRLNTMVRDMQALSQASGKSIDQITAMQQNNTTGMNQMMGYGGEHFASSATSYGVTTGQAFQQVGGATGFGALSREEAEAASQSFFQRSMSSEMANTIGTVKRLEDSKSINEDGAGKDLTLAMQAIRQGDEFYTDSQGQKRRTPTKEHEFRQFFIEGAADNVSVGDFNMKLGQTSANREALAGDSQLAEGVVGQQYFEFEEEAKRSSTHLLRKTSTFNALGEDQKGSAAASVADAAINAMTNLSPEEYADTELRDKVMTEAIQSAAKGIDGLEINEAQALVIADNVKAQTDEVARGRSGGALNYLGLTQVQGKAVSSVRRSTETQSKALAKQNEAMSVLGQKGSGMRRLFTALQKQGDKGEEADLNTLIGDIFGAEDINAEDLSESMQKVKELYNEADDLRAKLDDAPAEERRDIGDKLDKVTDDLMKAAEAAQTEGRRLGVNASSGTFNLEDNRRSLEALEEIDRRTDRSGLRDYIKNDSPVNAEDLNLEEGELTPQDIASLDKAAGTTSSKPELTEGVVDREKLEEVLSSVVSTGSLFDGTLVINKGMNSKLAAAVTDEKFNEGAEASLEEAFEAIKDDPQQLRNAIATGEAVMEDKRFNDKARPAFEKYQKIAKERLEKLEPDKKDEEPKDPNAKDYSKLEADKLTDEEKEIVFRGRRLAELDKGSDIGKKEVENRMAQRRQELSPGQAEFSKDENYDDFKSARSQLLAERSLQAIGVLDKKDSLMEPSNIDFDGAGISEEAINLIRSGDPAEQLKAVRQIAEDSRNKARDSGTKRVADIDEKDITAVAKSLSVLSASADEYLLDTGAITKGGGIGEAAAKDMQRALSDLQALANKHSVQKGDLGPAELLQFGVHGIGLDGAEVQDEIDSIRDRITKAANEMKVGSRNDYKNVTVVTDEQKAAAEEVLGEGLSDAQIKAYSLLEKTKSKAAEDVTPVTVKLPDGTSVSLGEDPEVPELEEVTELADNLIKLGDADAEDINSMDRYQQRISSSKKNYENSGLTGVMTEEEYIDTVTGKDSKIAESLTLFEGDADRLEEAKSLLKVRKLQQENLGKVEISHDAGEKTDEDVNAAQEQLDKTEKTLSGYADENGMSLDDWTTMMTYQDDLKELQDVEIPEGVDAGVVEAREMLKQVAFQETERQEKLSEPENIIRKALGFKLDDFDTYTTDVDFGTSDDNKRMLAEELEKLQTIDSESLGLATDATGIEKLDAMQDKYANATTSSDKDKLAKQLGLDRKQLDKSMAKTNFMQLDSIDMSNYSTPDAKAELMQDRLKSVENKSIEEAIKSEEARELTLKGNLIVRGDIQGEAILSDVVGLTTAAGAI